MGTVEDSLELLRIRKHVLAGDPINLKEYMDLFFSLYETGGRSSLDNYMTVLRDMRKQVYIQGRAWDPDKSGLRTLIDRRIKEREFESGIHLAPNKFPTFKGSEEYVFVKQFVKRFGRHVPADDLSKLQQLLSKKGWDFSNGELFYFVNEAYLTYRQEKFRSRFIETTARSREELLGLFVDLYSIDDLESIESFILLLRTEGLGTFTVSEIVKQLEQVEKDRDLEVFERQLFSASEQISIEDVDRLSGYAFESFLRDLYSRMGYSVEQTRLSGDQGADLVVVKAGERTVVQAKCYSGNVGNYAVQEIVAACNLYAAHKAVVVTNSFFTQAAIELASVNRVELIDRNRLEALIRKYW